MLGHYLVLATSLLAAIPTVSAAANRFNDHLALQAHGVGSFHSFAAEAASDDSTQAEVSIRNGDRNITVIGSTSTFLNTTKYLGIQYAKAPTENLRFKAPQPIEWNEDVAFINASAFGPACPQPLRNDTDENCLFLNVFTPSEQAISGLKKTAASLGGNGSSLTDAYANGLPVLVWIYGGES